MSEKVIMSAEDMRRAWIRIAHEGIENRCAWMSLKDARQASPYH